MRTILLTLWTAVLLVAAGPFTASASENKMDELNAPLRFKMVDIDGKNVDLSQYKGRVLLIVNTASKCGFTPQYKALQAVYEKYRDQGFAILAFPANNFGQQEPGTDEQIKSFCSTNYSVSFPLFSKVSVKGEDICPLYGYLTSEKMDPGFSGEIPWNFTKFLVDRKGRVVARYEPRTTPDDKALVEQLEKALAAK